MVPPLPLRPARKGLGFTGLRTRQDTESRGGLRNPAQTGVRWEPHVRRAHGGWLLSSRAPAAGSRGRRPPRRQGRRSGSTRSTARAPTGWSWSTPRTRSGRRRGLAADRRPAGRHPRPTTASSSPAGTDRSPRGATSCWSGARPASRSGSAAAATRMRLADAGGALADEIAIPSSPTRPTPGAATPTPPAPWIQTAPPRAAPNLPSTSTGEPPGDQAAWLFDPGQVVDIDLSIPQASREALADEPTEYQPATFSLTTDRAAPTDRWRWVYGSRADIGSFRPLTGKAAFKVKFAHSVAGQRFLGLKTLTLNNMVQDPSMLHEVFAYRGVSRGRRARAADRLRARAGRRRGVRALPNVETLDDVCLPQWFDSTQHLYEGEYGADVPPGQAGAFEVDEGSEGDRTDLERLIAQAHGAGDWLGADGGGGRPRADDPYVGGRVVHRALGRLCRLRGVPEPEQLLPAQRRGRALLACCRGAPTRPGTPASPSTPTVESYSVAAWKTPSCFEMYRAAVERVAETLGAPGPRRRGRTDIGRDRPVAEHRPARGEQSGSPEVGVERMRRFIAERPGGGARVDRLDRPLREEPPAEPPGGAAGRAPASAPAAKPSRQPGRSARPSQARPRCPRRCVARNSLTRVRRRGLRVRPRCGGSVGGRPRTPAAEGRPPGRLGLGPGDRWGGGAGPRADGS